MGFKGRTVTALGALAMGALVGCSGDGSGQSASDKAGDGPAPTSRERAQAQAPSTAVSSQDDAPTAGWIYTLSNTCAQAVLGVPDAAAAAGVGTQLARPINALAQQWKVEAADAGYVTLRAQHSGRLLEAAMPATTTAAGSAAGAPAQQGDTAPSPAAQWRVVPLGDGYVRLQSRLQTGLSLDVADPTGAPGAGVRIAPDNALTCTQRWRLLPYGVRATYFQGEDLTEPTLQRLEAAIDNDWGVAGPGGGVRGASFGARWTGRVIAPVSGPYTFQLDADDGRRLWIDGRLLIDRWVAKAGVDTAQVTLQAGQAYDLRLEYFQEFGTAKVSLAWSPPGLPLAPVPANNLLPDLADPVLGPPSPPLPLPFATPSAAASSLVIGWPAGVTPKAPPGFVVERWWSNFISPRWVYQLPNGDVLVAEGYTNGTGFGRLDLLRDTNGDGLPDQRFIFLQNEGGNLNQPFGMVLVGGNLYVANTDGLWRYPYTDGATSVAANSGVKVLNLPADGYNNHWTRNVIASPDGKLLYVTVGSATNVDVERQDVLDARRASILEYTIATGTWRIYASGLRNPNGMDWEPVSGRLWAAVNERDLIGDNLVPDFITSVRDGAFYGWPYFYFGTHRDPRKAGERFDLSGRSVVPDLAVGAHTATLGLAFYKGTAFPEPLRRGAFIGQRGSWNRSELTGYRVAYVPFDNRGLPAGPAQDFLTGFIADDLTRTVYGRPVDVLMLKDGSLLVTDDVAQCIWRVRYVGGAAATPTIGGLMLYDAASDRPIAPLVDGMVLDDGAFRTSDYSVVATSVNTLGSVRFAVDGRALPFENIRPYSLNGDGLLAGGGSDYRPWRPGIGSHVVEVTPYSGPNGSGIAGPTVRVQITRK